MVIQYRGPVFWARPPTRADSSSISTVIGSKRQAGDQRLETAHDLEVDHQQEEQPAEGPVHDER